MRRNMFSGYSLLCRGNWPETIYNISTSHVTPKYRVPGIMESTSRIYITSRKVLCPFPLLVAMLHLHWICVMIWFIWPTGLVKYLYKQYILLPIFYGPSLFFSTSSWLIWMKNEENNIVSMRMNPWGDPSDSSETRKSTQLFRKSYFSLMLEQISTFMSLRSQL